MKWVENRIMPIELFFAINADALDGYSILKNLDKKHWITPRIQEGTNEHKLKKGLSSFFLQFLFKYPFFVKPKTIKS